MQNKYTIKDVYATFKYGRLFKGWLLGVFYSLGILGLAIALISIFPFIKNDLESGWIIIICGIFFLVGSLVFIICNEFVKYKIKLWLKDAVEREVFVHTVDSDTFGRYSKGTQLFVKFKYEGKNVRKHSGYSNCFNIMGDRYLKLLYSPKYDEIIVLNQ